MKRLFYTREFVENRSLRFRGIIARRKEISNVRLVIIRTNTTKEGDTVLWT